VNTPQAVRKGCVKLNGRFSSFLLSLYSSPKQRRPTSRRESEQLEVEPLRPRTTETSEIENPQANIHPPQESIPRFHEGQYTHLNAFNNERLETSFMGTSHSAPLIGPNDIPTYSQANFDHQYYSPSNPTPNYVSQNNDHSYSQYPAPTQYDHYNWSSGENASHVNEQEPDHQMDYNPYYSPSEHQQNHPYGHQRQ
jgi:hypothetical protein